MRTWLLAIVFIGIMGVPNACAGLIAGQDATPPGDPTPHAPSAVHARYLLQLRPQLDAFNIEIRLQVHEIELQGPQGMPAQSIRDGGPSTRLLFEDAVRTRLSQELAKAFPESEPVLTDLSVQYGTSDHDADLYRPAIGVVAKALLPLSPSLLGASEVGKASAADWSRAFFYSGGSARVERSLMIPAGFDAGLRIEVPQTLRLGTPGRQSGTAAEFNKDNMRGQGALPLYVRFVVGLEPDQVPQNVLDGPLVRATFRADDATPLWLQAVPFTHGRYVADLSLEIELHSLPTSLFEDGIFPKNLQLQHLSADLLRVAVRDGLVSEAELEGYFHALLQQSLREDFGDDVVVHMDSQTFQQTLRSPIGGSEVAPLLVRAQARLPIQSDQMLGSSAMARSLGMITGTTGSFDLKNEGDWRLELVLLYPEGARIKSGDSLGRVQELQMDGRQGFSVYLAPGEATKINVWGRPAFDPVVFLIGLLEIAALVTGAIYVSKWARSRIRGKTLPDPRNAA